MDRVDPQRFEGLDLTRRSRRAEFDDVGRADARQHQERGQEWP